MPDRPNALLFQFFNEVGIIEQLGRALFEARLPAGFLVSQFTLLNHLVRVEDGRTPLALARAFQVPKTTMTHTLAQLERHGLIEMRDNPDDGRSKRVWITPAGRAFREAAIDSLTPDLARLNALLADTDFTTLVPMLERIRILLDQDRSQSPAAR